MSPDPIDPIVFRESQRALWGSVAAGWRAWWPVFESGAQPLNDRLLDLARVAPGARVLDVATGIGEPAITAAKRVGPRGSVLAVDLAPAMLAFARERAAEAGILNVEFREGDAEALVLEPTSFDAALSRWGVMLLAEPARAVASIRAALRPEARFACAVWGTRERVPFIAIPIEVAERELALDPPLAGAPGPSRFGHPGDLEALLAAAGLRDIRGETMAVTVEFASSAEYVRFLQDLSGSLRKTLLAREPLERERVWKAIELAARAHATSDGRVRFENEARLATGMR